MVLFGIDTPAPRHPAFAHGHGARGVLSVALKANKITNWSDDAKRRHALLKRLNCSAEEAVQRGVQLVVDSDSEPLPFHLQGDLAYYEEDTLRQRMRLRTHPRVDRVLNLWWQCARRLHVQASVAKLERSKPPGGSTQRPSRLDPIKGEHPEKVLRRNASERAVERSRANERRMRTSGTALLTGTAEEQRAALIVQAAFRGSLVRRVSKEQYIALSCKLYFAMGEPCLDLT
jgi:hypothetical protein